MDYVQDVTTTEQEVYRLLTKIFLLLDDCDRQFFASQGLSMRQFWALYHLDESHGLSMAELSKRLITDKSNVTAIIDRLEKSRLVQRTAAAHDRRVIIITLTSDGRIARDRLVAKHLQHMHSLFNTLGQESLAELQVLLAPLVQDIGSYISISDREF